jgi:hypothetical protein
MNVQLNRSRRAMKWIRRGQEYWTRTGSVFEMWLAKMSSGPLWGTNFWERRRIGAKKKRKRSQNQARINGYAILMRGEWWFIGW